jgi:predicted AlkP superfamily pyrophosphatase or phosphodiesterase
LRKFAIFAHAAARDVHFASFCVLSFNPMRKLLFIIIACTNLFVASALSEKERHVILITIDGLRPDFYLENTWRTPNLHQMAQEGSYAYGVNSVFPSVTYPSHTTIVTGVQPAVHGIFYNGMFEPDSITGKIYWNFHQITAPTLWQVVTDAGLKASSINWPASAEAPVTFNIPDIGGKQEKVLRYAVPEGFIDTLNQQLFHGKELSDINLGKDQNSAKIAAWVIKKDQPHFLTVHLFSVDHFEHEQGRHGEKVEAAIADADEGVGIIRDAVQDAGIADNTLIIVAGDHGFLDVTVNVHPNVWLAKAGLLDNPNGKWKARFHTNGGSAFLFLKDKNDEETLQKVKTILENLPAEEKKYIRIITTDEARKIGADPNAALQLSGLNGASFGKEYTGNAIRAGKGGTHGYYPDFREIQTGFICIGKNVKNKNKIKEMNLRDITAIVVKYLGLQMPSCQGQVPADLFK